MTDLAGPPIPEFRGFSITHRKVGPEYRVRIDHAPARTRLPADLLMKAMEGELPHIEVDGEQLDRIVITDDYGQRFIYRLGNYEALYDAFEMEWPD